MKFHSLVTISPAQSRKGNEAAKECGKIRSWGRWWGQKIIFISSPPLPHPLLFRSPLITSANFFVHSKRTGLVCFFVFPITQQLILLQLDKKDFFPRRFLIFHNFSRSKTSLKISILFSIICRPCKNLYCLMYLAHTRSMHRMIVLRDDPSEQRMPILRQNNYKLFNRFVWSKLLF